MQAIYYPKLSRLSYWVYNGTTSSQHTRSNLTLTQAKAILYDLTVQTELIQPLEVFRE